MVTEEDAWAIQHEVPFVDATAAFATSRVTLVHRNKNWITVLNAITPEFLGVHEWAVSSGQAGQPGRERFLIPAAMQEIRAVLRRATASSPTRTTTS